MKCMIVGFTSSISGAIRNKFSENGYEIVTACYGARSENPCDISFSLSLKGELIFDEKKYLENLDAVVFCIGRLYGTSIVDYSDEDIQEAFNANIVNVIKIIKHLLPTLNDKASVVFIGSISASAGSFDEIYSSSKSALYGLTKSLGKNSKRGIRFNCVSPGLIEDSAMCTKFSQEIINKHVKETPTGSLIRAGDIASILFDICQPHWASLNGQIIDVNGGRYV